MLAGRILVIEDAEAIRAAVSAGLTSAGHDVLGRGDGGLLEQDLAQFRPDVVVLDVTLPGRDGFALLESVRARSTAGVVMLTARDGVEDRVRGLRAGSDDYVVKPFDLTELVARVDALLRRMGKLQSRIMIGDLEVDVEAGAARRAGAELTLTATEFKLLAYLAAQRDRVVTKTQILTAVWGYEDYDPNLVEVHVSALRRKLEEHGERVVHTVRGLGYSLRVPPVKTLSLRGRVTLTAAAVSGVTLVLVAVIVHSLFALVLTRSENTVLTDRAQLARTLAQQGVAPEDLIARVDTHSVRARLVLTDGHTYGSLAKRVAEDSSTKNRTIRLTGPGTANDARLTLQIDTPLLARVQNRLGILLTLATATAITVIVIGLWFGIRRALQPLDTMTRLARDIAHGHLGRRLEPARTDTELGRTAAAFDEMLDTLEGALRDTAAAEARARASEQRIRSFVGDAAHELRTPITGVRSLAEAVFQQPADADPEERQRMLLLLVRETQRAGRLVDDLLDLARIDAGLHLRHETVDLRALAATQLDRMRMLHPDIDFRLTGDPVTVSADPGRVTQILTNLISNAAQAMKEHGAISVHIATGPTGADLTVSDTGPGIPESDRERVFDRLVRLDTARDHRPDGSGLGLSIARGLARAHGGDLYCAAPPSDQPGAVFVLRLPLGTPDALTAPIPR